MKYPSFEVRMSREQATRTLSRICERLDECPTASVDKPLVRFGLKQTPGPVTAKRLWVAGSYARGALTCGDLDLVMEVDNRRYGARHLNRLLLKSPPRVSLYEGTPDLNSSHAEFPEAVLVWESGNDWRAALAAIQPDESATRFDRPTDRIPFRLDQLGCAFEEAEDLLSKDDQRELSWDCVPLEAVTPRLNEPQQMGALKHLERESRHRRMGEKGRQLLPYIEAYARTFNIHGKSWDVEGQTRVRWGATVFCLGRTSGVGMLDEPGIQEVVVVPYLNARGPNGFWVIRRGENHPLMKVFAGCEAWVITDRDDKPQVVETTGFVSTTYWPDTHVNAVDIFQSESEALEHVQAFNEEYPTQPEYHVGARHISGVDFLDVLGYGDMLSGGYGEVVFSDTGERLARFAGFNEEDGPTRLSLEELANLFRPGAS